MIWELKQIFWRYRLWNFKWIFFIWNFEDYNIKLLINNNENYKDNEDKILEEVLIEKGLKNYHYLCKNKQYGKLIKDFIKDLTRYIHIQYMRNKKI